MTAWVVGATGGRGAARWLVRMSAAVGVGLAGFLAAVPSAVADGPCGTTGSYSTSGSTATCKFPYTGAAQTFVVPSGVQSINVDALGAAGDADILTLAAGGLGARVQGTLAVTPGDNLQVNVGGQGIDGGQGPWAGGWNGGGCGGDCSGGGPDPAGGGGGASDVRDGSDSLTDRLLVAGGGGGAGGGGFSDGVVAGGGGGNSNSLGGFGDPTIDQAATAAALGVPVFVDGGSPGGPVVFGVGGFFGSDMSASGAIGDVGTGGNGGASVLGGDGGGGAGGYYGGGGGGAGGTDGAVTAGGGGGGGGSDFTGSATNTTVTDGYQSGDGQVTISYTVGSSGIAAAGTLPGTYNGNPVSVQVSTVQRCTPGTSTFVAVWPGGTFKESAGSSQSDTCSNYNTAGYPQSLTFSGNGTTGGSVTGGDLEGPGSPNGDPTTIGFKIITPGGTLTVNQGSPGPLQGGPGRVQPFNLPPPGGG